MSGTLVLGIDVSTQSVSAVVVSVETEKGLARIVDGRSLPYRDDPRLNRYGIDHQSLLVPPRVPGEADQPPAMFLAGLDALFHDFRKDGLDLADIAAISVSAQQHGHVYLSGNGLQAIADLARSSVGGDADLPTRLNNAFSYGTAPIWQTADSLREAEEIRNALGGTRATVKLSGSDSPARFTGAVIRRTARRYPDVWEATSRVALLSNFVSAVLTANPDCPIDWGNGAGMTLMDYEKRQWSSQLLSAVAEGLSGGPAGLADKLPQTASPVTPAGTIGRYFVERYGFSEGCLVNIGSGDNPQSKVSVDGDLLSLGSSFVYMVNTGTPMVDLQGYANSMYDGLGRPFVFACRTNGAMVWDRLRSTYRADLDQAEKVLQRSLPGTTVAIWQPYQESYPVAAPIDHPAAREGVGDFDALYPAIVDSALVLTRYYARNFEVGTGPLALTGGPTASPAIQRRTAAIFERPVVVIGSSGAALGSALSAWQTLCDVTDREARLEDIRRDLVPVDTVVEPEKGLVRGYKEATPAIVEAFENVAGKGAAG